jgi:hypothetical protein
MITLITALGLAWWMTPVIIAWRRRTRHLWWIAMITFGALVPRKPQPPLNRSSPYFWGEALGEFVGGWLLLWIPMLIMALIGKLRAADRKQGGAA